MFVHISVIYSLFAGTGLEKVVVKSPTNVITLNKDGAGLGFSIEGGKDSPQGDVPLLIKKIFQGIYKCASH